MSHLHSLTTHQGKKFRRLYRTHRLTLIPVSVLHFPCEPRKEIPKHSRTGRTLIRQSPINMAIQKKSCTFCASKHKILISNYLAPNNRGKFELNKTFLFMSRYIHLALDWNISQSFVIIPS